MLIRKPKPILSLSEQEYVFFAELLEKGYPLLDAMRFLQQDVRKLEEVLQRGGSVEDLFFMEHPDRFHQHLKFFMSVSSLSGAIRSALHMKDFEQQIKKKLLKKCSYPMFLFVFAFVIMWMFTRYIIPQMLESFEMDDTFQTLLSALQLLQNFLLCMMILIILVYVITNIIKQEKRSILLFQYAKHIVVIKDALSYQLAGYLGELEQKGIATKLALHYLLDMKQDTLFYQLIYHMVEDLNTGRELLDIIMTHELLNESFQLMFRIGALNGSLSEMLSLFMKQQELKWDQSIRVIGLIVQIVAYICIAFLVLIVYQIMLVPLEMLETM